MVNNSDTFKKLEELKKDLEKDEEDKKKEKLRVIKEKTVTSLTLREKAIKKDKFPLHEQKKYLQKKGIDFKGMSNSEITTLLTNSTYYFKLTTYRKNYMTNKDGEYEGLTLKQLKDLSTIDMYLRFIIIQMTLEIEHSLKTNVINKITEDSNENGYTIIEEFDKYLYNSYLLTEEKKEKERKKLLSSNIEIPYYLKEKRYTHIIGKIMARNSSKTDYSYDLYKKRNDNPAVWVLIELMSYGELGNFLEFYAVSKKRGYKELKKAGKFIRNTKKMRNAAAHNRPIIYDISTASSINGGLPLEIRQYLGDVAKNDGSYSEILRNIKFFDFLTILLLHDTYITSAQMKKVRKNELRNFIRRCYKNKNVYDISYITNQHFKNILNILVKVVDHYGKQ